MAGLGLASTTQFVPFTYTNNIQTALISTFPTGTYTAVDGTQFSIPSAPGNCGPSGSAVWPCNYYDAGSSDFTSGKSLTINVSFPNATDVYTLMNAYAPPQGVTVGTIQFVGTGGAQVTFNLIGGNDIRDFYNSGSYSNGLTNTVPGVSVANTFKCTDSGSPVPSGGCLGAGGSGNVNTGSLGNYVVDEQHFSLGSTFTGQTLTQIILTNSTSNSQVILLGMTAAYTPNQSVPVPALSPWGLAILGVLLAVSALLIWKISTAVSDRA
jgi:hypothetical protein